MITSETLKKLYAQELLSANEIAKQLQCSPTKVNYWLKKHGIKKRKISDAVYARSNPHGDPFSLSVPTTNEQWFLYGLGLGLFWGEGNKMNKNAVRLGNTDPGVIRYFLKFLVEVYDVDMSRLRFGLQVFSDMDPKVAKQFWIDELNVPGTQFQKVIVTPARSIGTYTRKSKYGVLTIYFSNTKLRDMIVGAITELQEGKMPT